LENSQSFEEAMDLSQDRLLREPELERDIDQDSLYLQINVKTNHKLKYHASVPWATELLRTQCHCPSKNVKPEG
jgi:hypothetical protein